MMRKGPETGRDQSLILTFRFIGPVLTLTIQHPAGIFLRQAADLFQGCQFRLGQGHLGGVEVVF